MHSFVIIISIYLTYIILPHLSDAISLKRKIIAIITHHNPSHLVAYIEFVGKYVFHVSCFFLNSFDIFGFLCHLNRFSAFLKCL